jgi:salicylate hydroxylase
VWTCSRFGFQKVFRQVAEERGIKVEFSTTIENVDVETTTVVLPDGRKLDADLIIGADGKCWRTPLLEEYCVTINRCRIYH